MGAEFVQISLLPLLIGVLAAAACALPGNFLVLQRQALIGDAISHVVLPGIVAAFLITGGVSSGAMLLGAGAAALLAVGMIEAIQRLGRIEAGAAMGVTFTTLFAGGVLLLEQSGGSNVYFDVDHALMGNLESLIWFEAEGWHSLLDAGALAGLPPEFWRLSIVTLVVAGLTWVFWRWLKISTFDPGFARSLGLPTGAIGTGLVMVAALAAVAAFDAVGSIIVIAMFICPPASARLMTDKLSAQVWWSLAFAAISAVLGYVLAGYGPIWLGADRALSAAGMIAAVSGAILAAACLAGPRRQQSSQPVSGNPG
ncbi:MAG: metal ABC transporter permease [Pseudomonadota bacterium]